MVNLNLISKDKFQKMGFKNKTTGIAFIKTILQTKVNRFNTIEQLTTHVKPKINKIKDLGIDVNVKQNSIIHKGLKQLKQLNTKKGQRAITNMINKIETQINTKRWNITGKIRIKIIWAFSVFYKRKKDFEYDQEEIDSIIFQGTKDDAIEEFKHQMFEKHERYDPSPDITYKVVEIIITSMVEHTTTTTQQQDIPMKNSSQLMHNYIDEHKDFLQNTGTCVIDNFIGMYDKELKLTRDEFISMCKEYNDQNWTPEYGVSPRCVNSICEKYDISHYGFVVKPLRTKYFDELNDRIHFSKDFKQLVLDKTKNKCEKCECCLKGKKYDIDHVRPLSNGGTNELNNLQVLCKSCNQDKSANEQENGQFVKFSDTESSFNENVQEIMNSPLSHSFAFVESVAKPGNKKIFTIDINKCRRNILLKNKHDYCIFNVMNEPKTFNLKSPIFEGLYYIETDNYLPEEEIPSGGIVRVLEVSSLQ
jgi:5-methylcytosine-specific restriction protein A